MDSDLPARALADARRQTPTPAERSRLMPFREAVLTHRARRTSFEKIARFLQGYGVAVAPSTVSFFCRKHCPAADVERVRRELASNSAGAPNLVVPPIASAPSPGPGPDKRCNPRIARDDL